MVTAVTPLNGSDDFEGPIFGINSHVDEWFVLDSAPHISSVFGPPPYFFPNKVLDTSLSIVLHSNISVNMPAIFPAIVRYLQADILFY